MLCPCGYESVEKWFLKATVWHSIAQWSHSPVCVWIKIWQCIKVACRPSKSAPEFQLLVATKRTVIKVVSRMIISQKQNCSGVNLQLQFTRLPCRLSGRTMLYCVKCQQHVLVEANQEHIPVGVNQCNKTLPMHGQCMVRTQSCMCELAFIRQRFQVQTVWYAHFGKSMRRHRSLSSIREIKC